MFLTEFTSHYLAVHFLRTCTQVNSQCYIYYSSWPWSPNEAETRFAGELNKIWLQSTAVFYVHSWFMSLCIRETQAGHQPLRPATGIALCSPSSTRGAEWHVTRVPLQATETQSPRRKGMQHSWPLFSYHRRSVHLNDVTLTSGGW